MFFHCHSFIPSLVSLPRVYKSLFMLFTLQFFSITSLSRLKYVTVFRSHSFFHSTFPSLSAPVASRYYHYLYYSLYISFSNASLHSLDCSTLRFSTVIRSFAQPLHSPLPLLQDIIIIHISHSTSLFLRHHFTPYRRLQYFTVFQFHSFIRLTFPALSGLVA